MKHAKPNNTLDFSDIKNFFHPILKLVPYDSVPNDMIGIFDSMVQLGWIYRNKQGYNAKEGFGFPRVLINIPQEEDDLIELSYLHNKNHYDQIKKIFVKTLPRCKLREYTNAINNISPAEITDIQKNKILFERTLGNTEDPVNVIAYGNNKQTLFAAAKRQMKTAPTPDPNILQQFINYSKKIIDDELGPYLKHFSYDVTQWINHLNYAKQKAIIPIHEYCQGTLDTTRYTKKQMRDMLSLSYTAICKTELQPPDGKPRMVCSIPQMIKYTMGPVTWKLEEICQQQFKGYCGGKNLQQMAQDINKYLSQGFTKIVEGDGSAFDNTQDVTLKEIDRYIYRQITHSIYHVSKKKFRKISQAMYKHMKIKYSYNKHMRTYFSYYILGTVFSGDCDTTLCNTLRMALYNRFVNDQAGLVYGKDYIVFSKGDDFSVLYKPYIQDDVIRQIYNKYFLNKPDTQMELKDIRQYGIGQILKFLTIGKPDTFSFCSLRSWYTNINESEITLTRDPKKLFNESLYSIKYKTYNIQQRAAYHLDLAMSYITNYYGIDIFHIMAQAHFQEYKKYKKLLYKKYAKIPDPLMLDTTIKIKIKSAYTTLVKKQFKQGPQKTLYTESELFGKFIYLYNRVPNKNFYKIMGSYWETMKNILATRETLNKEQLKCINQQINSEFNIDYLKALVNQKNILNYQEMKQLLEKELHTFKVNC
jgi:hypothetical protein